MVCPNEKQLAFSIHQLPATLTIWSPKPTATTSGSSFVLQNDSSTTNAKFKTNAKQKGARNSKI